MPDKLDIEQLISTYLRYWEQSDIDGLMSMYDENMTYRDMPSGDVIEYTKLKQFLTNNFTNEKDQQYKLKDSVFVEGNSAFIYWLQSFSIAETGKNVKVNGVELIVFREDKIISIHEFYDYRISALEEASSPVEGSHLEKMTKLGLDRELMQKIADETIHYFDEQKPFLEPDLNLTMVSNKLGYTRNQISYVINHVLDRTFYDLLNGRRIDYVMQQMSATKPNPSILEMAINAGFNSVSGFYSAFKKHSGMTPAQYQRKHSS
jgi:AraC-like DNA-binding protein/ketosteroid isomerase-like protein